MYSKLSIGLSKKVFFFYFFFAFFSLPSIKFLFIFLFSGKKIFIEIEKKKNKSSNKSPQSNKPSLIVDQDIPPPLERVFYDSDNDNDDDNSYNSAAEEEEIEAVRPPIIPQSTATRQQDNQQIDADNLLVSIILALNACYHVCLQNEHVRKQYRQEISKHLRSQWPCVDDEYVMREIDLCYEVFLDEIHLPDAIARNQALKENIFMMLICIELKIPLFIIGKPGSSKSLAKTLISLKMQGSDRLASPVLSNFKEAQLITFQCSPMSTSEMILKTFRYCAKYQLERESDLDRYTSVVVLDEIGLAEASTSMPLKALHPLLEDGVHFEKTDEDKIVAEKRERERLRKEKENEAKKTTSATATPLAATSTAASALAAVAAAAAARSQQTEVSNEDWHRVGFIGISNWVLDPAKMNRGKTLFFF